MDRPFPPFRKGIGPKKKLVLLLSTGDVCRSPMAAGYLRKLLIDRKITTVEIRPAGVLTVPGLRATAETIQIMEAEGIDITRHQSCQLSPELIRKCDLILGMTPLHVQEALKISKDAKGKSYLLKEFARSDLKNIQIPDPMGTTLEYYKKCFKEIKAACESLVDLEFFGGSRKARAISSIEVAIKAKTPNRAPRAAMNAAPARKPAEAPEKPKSSAKPAAPEKKPAAAPAKKAAPAPPAKKASGKNSTLTPESASRKAKPTVRTRGARTLSCPPKKR